MSNYDDDKKELEGLSGRVKNLRSMFEKNARPRGNSSTTSVSSASSSSSVPNPDKKLAHDKLFNKRMAEKEKTTKAAYAQYKGHESLEHEAFKRQREMREADRKAGESAMGLYRQASSSIESAEMAALRRQREQREAERKAEQEAMAGYRQASKSVVSAELEALRRHKERREAEKKAEEEAMQVSRQKTSIESAELIALQRQREMRNAEKKAEEDAMQGYRQTKGGFVSAELEALRRAREMREADRKAEIDAMQGYRKASASVESAEMAALRRQRELREAERKAEGDAMAGYRQFKSSKTLLDFASDSQKQREAEDRRIAQESKQMYAKSTYSLDHDHVYNHAQRKKETEMRLEKEAKDSLRTFSSGRSYFDAQLEEKKRRDEEAKKKEMEARAAIANNKFTSIDLDKSYAHAKELAKAEKEAEEKAKAALLKFSSAGVSSDVTMLNGVIQPKSAPSSLTRTSSGKSYPFSDPSARPRKTPDPAALEAVNKFQSQLAASRERENSIDSVEGVTMDESNVELGSSTTKKYSAKQSSALSLTEMHAMQIKDREQQQREKEKAAKDKMAHANVSLSKQDEFTMSKKEAEQQERLSEQAARQSLTRNSYIGSASFGPEDFSDLSDEEVEYEIPYEQQDLVVRKAIQQAEQKALAEETGVDNAEPASHLRQNTTQIIEGEPLAKEEAERLAKEEADRLEAERLAKEEADRLEAERVAKEEAERLAKEEADRLEAERLAKEEADRLEAERLAKEEADRLEAERVAKEEAERLAKEEAQRLAVEEAGRLAVAEAERLAKVEANRLVNGETVDEANVASLEFATDDARLSIAANATVDEMVDRIVDEYESAAISASNASGTNVFDSDEDDDDDEEEDKSTDEHADTVHTELKPVVVRPTMAELQELSMRDRFSVESIGVSDEASDDESDGEDTPQDANSKNIAVDRPQDDSESTDTGSDVADEVKLSLHSSSVEVAGAVSNQEHVQIISVGSESHKDESAPLSSSSEESFVLKKEIALAVAYETSTEVSSAPTSNDTSMSDIRDDIFQQRLSESSDRESLVRETFDSATPQGNQLSNSFNDLRESVFSDAGNDLSGEPAQPKEQSEPKYFDTDSERGSSFVARESIQDEDSVTNDAREANIKAEQVEQTTSRWAPTKFLNKLQSSVELKSSASKASSQQSTAEEGSPAKSAASKMANAASAIFSRTTSNASRHLSSASDSKSASELSRSNSSEEDTEFDGVYSPTAADSKTKSGKFGFMSNITASAAAKAPTGFAKRFGWKKSGSNEDKSKSNRNGFADDLDSTTAA